MRRAEPIHPMLGPNRAWLYETVYAHAPMIAPRRSGTGCHLFRKKLNCVSKRNKKIYVCATSSSRPLVNTGVRYGPHHLFPVIKYGLFSTKQKTAALALFPVSLPQSYPLRGLELQTVSLLSPSCLLHAKRPMFQMPRPRYLDKYRHRYKRCLASGHLLL